MKNTLIIVSIFLTIICQKSSAQCLAVISSFPHGDCEGTDIELFASGGGTFNGYKYQWTGPDNFTCNNQFAVIPQASASASGIYKVIVTDPNGCKSVDSIEIIKHPNPIVYTGGNAGGCLGETTYIYAEDFSGDNGPYTYLWDNGASGSSLAVNHGGGTYPAPGCTITNMYGCSSSNNTTFLIYTLPTPESPVIEALNATAFCKGESVTLVSNTDTGELDYSWSKDGSVIESAMSNEYTAAQSGKYSLNVSNSLGCSSPESNIIKVTTFSLPEVSVSVKGSANICKGAPALISVEGDDNLTYQWMKDSLSVGDAASASFSANVKGNYFVVATNHSGCTKVSNTVLVTSLCDTESKQAVSNDIKIFPNPSNDVFNIDLKALDKEGANRIVITDFTGRVINEIDVLENKKSVQFGESLPVGIYNIQVIKNNLTYSKRIVKT